MLIDRIMTIVALVIMMVSLFICGACVNNTKIAEERLKEVVYQVKKEMVETEEKCRRYSDACIDILANKVWE